MILILLQLYCQHAENVFNDDTSNNNSAFIFYFEFENELTHLMTQGYVCVGGIKSNLVLYEYELMPTAN